MNIELYRLLLHFSAMSIILYQLFIIYEKLIFLRHNLIDFLCAVGIINHPEEKSSGKAYAVPDVMWEVKILYNDNGNIMRKEENYDNENIIHPL